MSDVPDQDYMNYVVQREDISLSDDSSVKECSVKDLFLGIESLTSVFDNERLEAVNARREEVMAENSIRQLKDFIEKRKIRSTCRQISSGLGSSLGNGDALFMRNHQIRMNAAERIAIRPLMHRAGYKVCSADPLVTRTGLPRSISMPDIGCIHDVSQISSLCMQYPETSDRRVA